jgi:hypothetical protein
VRDFLSWVESSALGQLMRDAGPWNYAVVNLTHVFGIAALFGSILVLDLRLLGLWRRVPIAALASATVPVGKTGIAVALTTGVLLLATNGSEYIGNPFLLVKFPAIGIGLINVFVLSRTTAWKVRGARELSPAEQRQLRMMGGISLVSWVTAVTAGRMIAYW